MDNSYIIGKTLKRIRLGKNLTVRYLTKNIITPQHYYKVESGSSYLSSNFLIQILNRMNVTLKEFSILVDSEQKKIF